MTRTYGQPWNKGRSVGPRRALTVDNVNRIRRSLERQANPHDCCLFLVAIDTMLRASDLLRLQVSDVVQQNGVVKTTFPWRQKKTANTVFPVLTPTTQQAITNWIKLADKKPDDFLFTREKPSDGLPITIGFYRTLIKKWVAEIGLPSENYSAHSLRRTKAIFLYECEVSVELIGRLLGHKSTASTIRYLGIDEAQAKQAALSNDIFKPKQKRATKEKLTTSEVDQIADQIWERLASRLPQNLTKNGE